MQDMLSSCLQSDTHGWSMGSFGAIGEFMWDQGEPLLTHQNWQYSLITPRGGLAFNVPAELKAIAYEYLARDHAYWIHGIALCLPEEIAKRPQHKGLTELGADEGALNPEYRHHRLFDMGLNQQFVDVAIRTDNPDLIACLREAEGSDLLAPHNPAMQAIIQAGPHRVFQTAMGRLEVYQPIGIEKSPEGPHTHVLPKLLASKRAFSANQPIPDGWLPVLTVHPANPCRDQLGKPKPFDNHEHQQFQDWLSQFGLPEYLKQKLATLNALQQGATAEGFEAGGNRLQRTATRVALRQFQRCYPEQQAALAPWRSAFDQEHHKEASA